MVIASNSSTRSRETDSSFAITTINRTSPARTVAFATA